MKTVTTIRNIIETIRDISLCYMSMLHFLRVTVVLWLGLCMSLFFGDAC